MAAVRVPADVIGRQVELAAVDRFVDRLGRGPAGLVIHGEAGIGKTAIWRAAVERALERGAIVLRSAPAESEGQLTLGGLTDLLSEVGTDRMAALPAVQRHALDIAILRTEPSGQLPDQRTLSVATTSLLQQLAGDGRLVIALDDAQWLDDASRTILAYAVRRLADRTAGILLAVRGDPTLSTLELAAGVPDEARDSVRLGPMPLAALHRLFMARFGRSFPRLVLVRIEEASGGNPFYALEIARTLAASDSVVRPGDRLPIPATLGALVEARIGALPSATRSALLLAALAAEPTIDTLRRVGPDAATALDPAFDAGVIAMDRRSIRFTHPLLAHAVTGVAAPAEIRRAHASLARAATSDDVRARHLGGATEGRHERVAAALEAAAGAARARGATIDAASLFERASDLTPTGSGDEALRRATSAAECLFIDVSEIVQADAILDAAIAACRAGAGARRGAQPPGTHPLLPRPDARSRSGSASRRSTRRETTRSGAPGSSAGPRSWSCRSISSEAMPWRRRPSGCSRRSTGRRPSTPTSWRTCSSCTRAPSWGSSDGYLADEIARGTA